MAALKKANGILVCSADHGNADDMYELDKKTGALVLDKQGNYKSKTAHSLNPVPAIIYDPSGAAHARLAEVPQAGIASLAATCITLLGYEPPADYAASLVAAG